MTNYSIPITALLVFVLVMIGVTCAHSPCSNEPESFADCSTNFATLERTLYEFGENRFRILSTFFPTREAVALYVDITYVFCPNETHNKSTEDWAWTSGSFYLIQPPGVFRFTSLFFVYPRERIGKLTITLPGACRNISGTTRTFVGGQKYEGVLEMLTQRLKLYAQYNSLDSVVQPPTGTTGFVGKAIPKTREELDKVYEESEVGPGRYIYVMFFLLTIFIPILVPILWYLAIKGSRVQIRLKILDTKFHPTFASLLGIGFWFSIYVVCMDCSALWFKDDWEKRGHHDVITFMAYHMVWVNLLIDFAATVCVFILCFIFCCCCTCKNDCGHWLLVLIFLGREKDQMPNWESQEIRMWWLCTLFIAPLVCAGSHVGYMILGWLADPQHGGAVFIIYILSFFYFFVTLKQIYLAVVELDCFKKKSKETKEKKSKEQKSKEKNEGEEVELKEVEGGWLKLNVIVPPDIEHTQSQIRYDSDSKDISLPAVISVFISGFFLALFELFVIYSFTELPLVGVIEDTPIYLLTLFQIAVLMVSMVLLYKSLSDDSPVERDLLRNMIENFKDFMYAGNTGNRPNKTKGCPRRESEVEKAATLLSAIGYNIMWDQETASKLIPREQQHLSRRPKGKTSTSGASSPSLKQPTLQSHAEEDDDSKPESASASEVGLDEPPEGLIIESACTPLLPKQSRQNPEQTATKEAQNRRSRYSTLRV